jgi:hypothetical protein
MVPKPQEHSSGRHLLNLALVSFTLQLHPFLSIMVDEQLAAVVLEPQDAVPGVLALDNADQPADPIPQAVAPPLETPTWDTLLGMARTGPHTLLLQIMKTHQDTLWAAIMAPTTQFMSQNPYNSDTVLWSYRDLLSTYFFLTVMGSMCQVVYSFHRCTPLHANGGRLAALQGDRTVIQNTVIPLSLYIKAQDVNTQSELFEKQVVVPYLLDIAQDLLNAPNTAHFLPAVIAPMYVAPLLPVHPKITAFLNS